MLSSVAVLDLDGVILQTNLVKYNAMFSLFAEFPKRAADISTFILANGGVPRRQKLESILRDILQIQSSAEVIEGYLTRYARALEDALATAPLVEGVREFVRLPNRDFYVSSSAPESEVHAQLSRHGLVDAFRQVFGSDTPKAQALRRVADAHRGTPVVYFGDSVSDVQAAQEAGVAFVGVIRERDSIGSRTSIKLFSFAVAAEVEQCIRSALCESAT